MISTIAQLIDEHVRAALDRIAATDTAPWPDVALDSWSDPAVPGEYVAVQDAEGRLAQARLESKARGVVLADGALGAPLRALCEAMVADLRRDAEAAARAGQTVVCRPPAPPAAGAPFEFAYVDHAGFFMRLTIGTDERGRPVAVLSTLLGRPEPLAEIEGTVEWLELG